MLSHISTQGLISARRASHDATSQATESPSVSRRESVIVPDLGGIQAAELSPMAAALLHPSRAPRGEGAAPAASLPALESIPLVDMSYLKSSRAPHNFLKDPVLLMNGETIERSELASDELHADNQVLKTAIDNREAGVSNWHEAVDIATLEPFEQAAQVISTLHSKRRRDEGEAPNNTGDPNIITLQHAAETYVFNVATLTSWVERKGFKSPYSKHTYNKPIVVIPNFAVQDMCLAAAGQPPLSEEAREALRTACQAVAQMRPSAGHARLGFVGTAPRENPAVIAAVSLAVCAMFAGFGAIGGVLFGGNGVVIGLGSGVGAVVGAACVGASVMLPRAMLRARGNRARVALNNPQAAAEAAAPADAAVEADTAAADPTAAAPIAPASDYIV